MLNDLPFLVLFTVSFMVLFALSETLFYRYQVQAEISRKLVHLGTGLLTLLFPLFLTDQASV
ncbi:MAG TPA: hypothetical protein VNZ86_12965, partial [Bacteroidia bacterium]|nr:hypothetical protein [Bacteroidia bacterium]